MAPSLGRRAPRPCPAAGPALPVSAPGRAGLAAHTPSPHPALPPSWWGRPLPPLLARLQSSRLCELRPSSTCPPPAPSPPPCTLPCLQLLRAGLEDRPPPNGGPSRVFPRADRVWGPSTPQGAASAAASIDNYPNPQRERGLLPWGGSPRGQTAAVTRFGSFPFFIEATLVRSKYQASR